MKKTFQIILCLSTFFLQNSHALFMSSRNNGDNSLAQLHSRIDNRNDEFQQYVSAPVNGVYTIKGSITNLGDVDTYKGLLIPHFDINNEVLEDNYAYSSIMAPGLPTTPAYYSTLSISKTAITIKNTDKDIYIDSDFDPKTGNAVRPKDPFTKLWSCTSGKHTYTLPVTIEGFRTIKCTVSHTCSHSSKVLPRNGRSADEDDFLWNSNAGVKTLPNGKKYKTGSYDAYPPVNFNHTQTITYSLTQMAQSIGCTTKELAALIVYYGINEIPLNKDEKCVWYLEYLHTKVLSYCLYKLFDLDDATIRATVDKFNGNSHESTAPSAPNVEKPKNTDNTLASLEKELDKLTSIQLSPSTNAEELRVMAKGLSDKYRAIADNASMDLDQINALNCFYIAQGSLIVSYVLKKEYSEADRLYKDTEEYFTKKGKFFPHIRFYMYLCYKLSQIKEFERSANCGLAAFNLLDNDPQVKGYITQPAYKEVVKELDYTYFRVLDAGLSADRAGYHSPRIPALNLYRSYFSSPLVTNNRKTSLKACEMYFYCLIDEMHDILDKGPINKQTAYYKGQLVDRAREFYNNQQLMNEVVHSYIILYKEENKKDILESVGIKCMMEYKEKNLYRSSKDEIFDQKMLKTKHNGSNKMIPINI